MLADVLERIEKRLKVVGLSPAAASEQAGLSVDAIRNIKRAIDKDDRQGISTRTLELLAPVLQTTATWLFSGVGPEGITWVPVIGRVGADPEGRIVYSDAHQSGDVAPPPPGSLSDCVAVQVVGHSMRGYADDGSLIYFETQKSPPTPDMIGYPAVVETVDGLVLLKRLLKGSQPGLYDLESINGPTMSDQALRWAAEITAIIPPKQARRIIRRDGIEAA